MYDYMKALQERFDEKQPEHLVYAVKSAREELRRDMDAAERSVSCSSLGGAGERRLFSRRSFCSLRRCLDSRFLAACSFLRSTAWTTSKPSATSRRSCRRSLCSLLAMRIFSTS